MKRRVVIFLLLVVAASSCVLHAEKLDEIKRYFELRDTLSLVNLEMKRALAPDSRSPMLSDPDAEQNLTRLIMFLEGRVKDFAQLNTPLRQHYIRNLNSLFIESRYLYANVLVKIRSRPVNQPAPVKTAPASVSAKLYEKPYFQPIDMRTLLSPALLNNRDLKKAESVWANQMQKATALNADDADVAADKPASSGAELFGKTPVQPVPEPRAKTTEVISSPPAVQEKTVASRTVEAPEIKKTQSLPATSPVRIEDPVETGQQVKPVENLDKPKANESSKVATSAVQVVPPPNATDIARVSGLSQSQQGDAASSTQKVILASAAAKIQRPLAVMIENHRKARPQSGLIDAELVYEMPVEGGITRFMAVFFHTPGILGPVRSCREYFVDRALEVAALYVHCGGSPKGYAYLSKTKINSIDEIKHGKPFYRDKSRKAPHNLYTRGQKIVDYMQNSVAMKLPTQRLPLNYGPVPSVGEEPGNELYIRYHGNYNTSYQYANGVYERYMNGKKHLDREKGTLIAPRTVILQTANMKTVDKVGRQEISFVGSGAALIFYRGKIIRARWQKKSAAAMTEYLDRSGNKVVFDKGSPVWVQVVSPSLKIKINGVDPEEKKKAAEPAVKQEAKPKAASEKS